MSDLGCCEESMSAYLDGELSNKEAQVIEIHLETCAYCRETLNRIQALSSTVRQVPRPTADPLLASHILSQIKAPSLYSEIPLIKLLESWGMLSLLTVSTVAILFGPVLLGVLYVVVKHLAIATSLVIKLSWQTPLDSTKILFGLIFIIGASIAFYGFGRVFSALSREGFVS